ncbi:MAG: histidine kinase [Ferruginibacter sp.]
MQLFNRDSFFRNRRFVLRNLLAWLLLYLLVFAAEFSSGIPDYARLLQVTGLFMFMIFIFYGHFFLCEHFFYKNRLLYFLLLAAAYAAFLWVLIKISPQTDLPAFEMKHKGKQFLLNLYISLYYFLLLLLSGFYWATLHSGKKIKENAAMQLALQKMETEKVYAEKQFLQSQVNPHFLYNTLNFLYAKSLPLSKELSDGIMTLSEIMKYALQKNENEKGMVLLSEELNHVQNVININQLRSSHKLQIVFSVSGDTEGLRILPISLITLTENALKHGELNDPANPVQVSLVCNEDDNRIHFTVINHKRNGPKERSTGLGLANLLQRLKWVYGDNFTLNITEDENWYRAVLILPLYR